MDSELKTAHQPLTVTGIGWMANQVLSDPVMKSRPASVRGVTSRGIFVMIANRWVVFLSREPYRGPLTVNLEGDLDALLAVEPRISVQIQENQVIFPSTELTLAIPDVEGWRVPDPSGSPLESEARMANLKAVAAQLLAQKEGAGFSAVLARVLDVEPPVPWTSDHEVVFNALKAAAGAVQEKDTRRASTALNGLIGRGAGLTPSGDDLVAGLLLGLYRWGERLGTQVSSSDLCASLIEAAYRRTTTLSANLLECASIGQADERLVDAVDGIVTGRPELAACVEKLARWGNSSGVDVLLGIALVLLDFHL